MYKTWYKSEKKPKFCSRCGISLLSWEFEEGFDPYTGRPNFKGYLVCIKAKENLLRSLHDVWEIVDDIQPVIKEMGWL